MPHVACVGVYQFRTHTDALVENGHAKVIEKEKPSQVLVNFVCGHLSLVFWPVVCVACLAACHTEQTRYARWLSWLSIIIHKYANRLRAECAINSLKAAKAMVKATLV